jgi:hypothetical protein
VGGIRAAHFVFLSPGKGTDMTYRKDWTEPQQGEEGFSRTMKSFGRKINITAPDNVTNNVIGLFQIPANFCITGIIGTMPAIGTAFSFSIGDPGNPARYVSGSGVGVAGGALPAIAASGLFFRTTAKTEIQMLVALQSSAFAAGVAEIYLQGFVY